MSNSTVSFKTDLLKHHVRYYGWLPFCKKRKELAQPILKCGRHQRSLRYFTFCAVSAMDVYMLNLEHVISSDSNKPFKNVTFFDKNDDLVEETKRGIPGATGFTGDFTKLVLTDNDDADEEWEGVKSSDLLDAPSDKPDDRHTRKEQVQTAKRFSLSMSFPYDIINLDLEGYVFRPGDTFPGEMIRALRHVFRWQRRSLRLGIDLKEKNFGYLNGFTLMFTTQVGPENLTDEYLAALRQIIDENIESDEQLASILEERTGTKEADKLQSQDFDEFFQIAIPKQLAKMLMEEDWCVDPNSGIRAFAFERQYDGGSYRMLHFVMHVNRQQPIRDWRMSKDPTSEAREQYGKVVRKIFDEPVDFVTDGSLDKQKLGEHIKRIHSRSKKYRV